MGAEQRDQLVISQREAFRAAIHPFVSAVISEDSYLSEALASLNPLQRDVFTDVVEEQAIVKYIGRTSKELVVEKPSRQPDSQEGRVVDPLLERYRTKFRRVGTFDVEGVINISTQATTLVLEAYRNDPDIPKMKKLTPDEERLLLMSTRELLEGLKTYPSLQNLVLMSLTEQEVEELISIDETSE